MQRILKIKKAIFICMVATPVTPAKYNVGLINRTHQHTHAGTQDGSKTNGWSS